MSFIEGEYKPNNHNGNKDYVELLDGKVNFNKGVAKFKVCSEREEVSLRAGHNKIDVCYFKGTKVALLRIFDATLQIHHLSERWSPISSYNGFIVLETQVAIGEILELKREGVFELILKHVSEEAV